ncbi:MAG TPA: hypothetical protein VF290_03530 [Pyrinomonadaceae bacterium]
MNERMRLLIAYDGSASAKEALNDLRRTALPAKSEALVVSVCDAVVPSDTVPAVDVRNMDDHDVGHRGIVSAALLSGAPCSVEIVRHRKTGH